MENGNMMRANAGKKSGVLAAMVVLELTISPPSALGQQQSTGREASGKAIAVEVIKSVRRPMVRELKMPATLAAEEQVDLFAKVSGYVAEINVDIGTRVNKGEVLVRLSIPEMTDELRQAQAVLKANQSKVQALRAKAVQSERMVEIARSEVHRHDAEHQLDEVTLKRKEELRAGNAIPAQALDEARSAHAVTEARLQIAKARVAGAEAELGAVNADVEVAQSEVMVARANLARLETVAEYAAITAPFDGVVTMRGVDHGTFVRSATAGSTTPLLSIARTDRIRIVLEIPEIDAVYVHEGTEVEIDVKALDERPFAGVVARTAGALKPGTRTMRVEVDVDNDSERYTPGMYAQVVVKLESKSHAMMIPARAIRAAGKDTVVLVSLDGMAKSRSVEVGYDDGIWAEIVSGLSEGEWIITSTSGAVVPGAPVTPVLAEAF